MALEWTHFYKSVEAPPHERAEFLTNQIIERNRAIYAQAQKRAARRSSSTDTADRRQGSENTNVQRVPNAKWTLADLLRRARITSR